MVENHLDYKTSGVDIEAGYRAVELMKEHISRTMRSEVLGSIGGFSGAFDLSGISKMKHPILVSGTDGVGTKVVLAFIMDKHDTVGIDCVAMCVNDIACAGGKPLFFLDYIACGRNYPEKIAQIVKGVADGCVMAEAALIGGETAEHPGLMPKDEYDLAGFTVGVVERDDMIDPSRVQTGDVIIGVASSGIHSNGFSMVRKIFPMKRQNLDCVIDELGMPLGEALLTPTRIYVKALNAIASDNIKIHGCAHITGGGFYENIPRMLPEGKRAIIKKNSYEILPIFPILQKEGNIEEQMMYQTFNMGLGMVMAVSPEDADRAVSTLKSQGERAWIIGEISDGQKGVDINE